VCMWGGRRWEQRGGVIDYGGGNLVQGGMVGQYPVWGGAGGGACVHAAPYWTDRPLPGVRKMEGGGTRLVCSKRGLASWQTLGVGESLGGWPVCVGGGARGQGEAVRAGGWGLWGDRWPENL